MVLAFAGIFMCGGACSPCFGRLSIYRRNTGCCTSIFSPGFGKLSHRVKGFPRRPRVAEAAEALAHFKSKGRSMKAKVWNSLLALPDLQSESWPGRIKFRISNPEQLEAKIQLNTDC